MSIATCIGCGCDDRHACRPEGCYWLRVDYKAGAGVCSQCESFVNAWDAGVRVRKFQPSNGTVGSAFLSDWCGSCEGGKDGPCGIAANTMFHHVDDPEYPSEWQFNLQGDPVCTAHVKLGQPTPEKRCCHTTEMFNGGPEA